ncbi:MAG: capsular polysaccharide biosynthesis protein [Marinovum sp.]|nr:capsular polysaccharide biosynthesis protein [Marinovum sp.]
MRRRLYVYNGGFLWKDKTIRRILNLAGYDVSIGLPSEGDLVGVWGNSPTAHRGKAVSEARGAGLVRVEDCFLRSVHPGRAGTPPLGLMIDHGGVHFDANTMSDLETRLISEALDDAAILTRAEDAIERIKDVHLSKYNAFDPDLDAPAPGYVLVIDQTKDDASVTSSGGNRAAFQEMLVFAQEEHPGARVLVKTHPETERGFRAGYFTEADETERVSLYTAPISPWRLFEGAVGVYTYSSQMGFEAIFAGHKPRVFGQPFYAGWGLTCDERPVPRRQRKLTRSQLFAAVMILAPTWYDPYRDQLCELEQVLDTLEAQTRAWREDRHGWTASGMRMWKRNPLQKVFGQVTPVQFEEEPHPPRRHMIWASKGAADVRVEDGFLRSFGLGATLIPPLSLVLDDLGIYYDPRHESRLERLLNAADDLRPDQVLRARHLRRSILKNGLSKYNLKGALPTVREGHLVLVAGQVEDDASISTGTTEVSSNLGLLKAARAERPDAVILYKPHPDVEAGLRSGAVPNAHEVADFVLERADPVALLGAVQEVWTMTSLLGFEALLRDVPVTTLGAPFYAGWGLTEDLGEVPARRQARLSLNQLVYAALIAYPRYFDPITGMACPPEVTVDRLASGKLPRPGLGNRTLAKLQGLFASYAHLWR